jgi:hypothetical protein
VAITAAESVAAGAAGLTASIPARAGSTYAWSVSGGTITGGETTNTVTYTAGLAGTRMTISVVETTAGCGTVTASKRVMVNFNDVPPSHPFYVFINRLARNGITAGCGGGNYCPAQPIPRSQMAVFLLLGKHGETYTPPPATGIFDDVPPGAFAANWIEQLSHERVTGGCSTAPPLYCPNDAVTRSQMAVFLMSSKHGRGYLPTPATGIFTDVPPGSFAANWIEKLFNEGITAGCTPTTYCPNSVTTRGEMAVFLSATFNLP